MYENVQVDIKTGTNAAIPNGLKIPSRYNYCDSYSNLQELTHLGQLCVGVKLKGWWNKKEGKGDREPSLAFLRPLKVTALLGGERRNTLDLEICDV